MHTAITTPFDTLRSLYDAHVCSNTYAFVSVNGTNTLFEKDLLVYRTCKADGKLQNSYARVRFRTRFAWVDPPPLLRGVVPRGGEREFRTRTHCDLESCDASLRKSCHSEDIFSD